MSFLRDDSSTPDVAAESGRQVIQWQRAARATHIGEGTLACAQCDAPVEIGRRRLSLTDGLTCSFCAHTAPVRDFVSLAQPTRATRIVLRVGF